MSGEARLGNAEFVRLVEMAYAAATEPGLWHSVLDRLTKVLRTAAASITVTDLRTIDSSVEWSVGIDRTLTSDYVRYYSAKNLYLAAGEPLLATGAVIIGEQVVPDRVALQSEFVNDFLMPMGVLHHVVGCIHRDGAVTAILNLPRALGKPSFSDSEASFCRRLLPHFQRALTVHRKLEGAELERTALARALDQLRVGTVLLDRLGRPLFISRSARQTLDAGDGLSMNSNGLTAARSSDASILRHQIHVACNPHAIGQSSDTAVRIGRPSLRREYVVMMAPLRLRAFAWSRDSPAAIVFIHDPDQVDTPEAPLRELYGLTNAEIRVVSMLLQGLRVEEIASLSNVGGNTVRVHLKRIFSKTGTRSQGDLMRVLLAGPAMLRIDETRR